MKTLIFHVGGMHCRACERLVEMELAEAPGVARVQASFKRHAVEVTGDFGERPAAEVARELAARVQPHGYALSADGPVRPAEVKWAEFGVALPAAVAFFALFVLVQELGVGKLITASRMGYGVAFGVGLVASVSSCVAVVGGFALSLSAFYAKEGDRVVPQMLFHVGRLAGFFVLGGVIGALGAGFQPGRLGSLVLGVAVGGVMILLGAGLLDVFPGLRRWQPVLPDVVGRRVRQLRGVHRGLIPLTAGVITFFLPCGFTQTMQFYTLTTGSFLTGALTMFCFALGTFPVLALLSFSPLELGRRGRSGVFFKAAGMIVIFFGIYNLLNSLAAYGIIRPLVNF